VRPDVLKWGLIHHGRRNEKIAYKTINARVETACSRRPGLEPATL
jgi:putative SOS response-associated peptidase YedK